MEKKTFVRLNESYVPFFAPDNYVAPEAVEIPDVNSLIEYFFGERLVKELFIHAMRVDIANNNTKASMIKELLPESFIELGTGTNRITLMRSNMAFKIALDRRGLVDNYTEYKRGRERPEFLARTYETNMLINVSEYVTVMDQGQFIMNEKPIKAILKELSEDYMFNDIGFHLKNSYNWGYRPSIDPDAPDDSDDIVVLDYGYLYPLRGQPTDLFTCPKCGAKLVWNDSYTHFNCKNPNCRLEYSSIEIWRRMDNTVMATEDAVLNEMISPSAPNYQKLEQTVAKMYLH